MRHSKVYLEFNNQVTGIIGYLERGDNLTRLGLNQAYLDMLKKKDAEWKSELALYVSVDTQTPTVVSTMRRLYVPYDKIIRALKKNLKSNILITLTDDDYSNLYIRRNKTTRTKAVIPKISPQLDLVETSHLTNKFKTSLPNLSDLDHKHLPKGALQIVRQLAILPITEPMGVPKESDFKTLDPISAASFLLVFEGANVSKIGFLKVAYANNAGVGPFSKEVSFNII